MNLDKKMKECMTPHAMMHGLMGLGLGIVLVSLVPAALNLWLGVALVVVAMVLDMMRK